MYRFQTVVLLLLATCAQALSAQHQFVDPLPSPNGHVLVSASLEVGPNPRTATRGLGHYFGGAVIGGWIGFVGAQVTHSDWERSAGGELREQRTTWALAGVALGLVTAHLIPSSAPRPVAIPERGFAPPTRNRLTAEDIRASGATNAFELIRGTRPEWLVTRGTNSWRETTQGRSAGSMTQGGIVVTRQGDPKILVYLNGLRLGGADKLADIDTAALSAAEFLDPHRAVFRFGSSAAHGAILLTTVVDAP
jgi:hypothetical protein